MNRRELHYSGRFALRVIMYELIFALLGLLLIPTVFNFGTIIRLVVSIALIILALLFLYTATSSMGETDCAASARFDKSAKVAGYVPNEDENAQRYMIKKALLGSFLGALPLLILSCILALTAKPYEYTLQTYPKWVNSYITLPEVGNALSYLTNLKSTVTFTDYIRVAVRFMFFPFLGVAGELNDAGSLLFDRITPLLSLIFPVVSFIGYLAGPMNYSKTEKAIAEAKSKPRKRLKKDAHKRRTAANTQQPKELI